MILLVIIIIKTNLFNNNFIKLKKQHILKKTFYTIYKFI